jgi:hypothetical protein
MPLSLEPLAPTDFDFIMGDWMVKHSRLNARFSGCQAWTEFEGLSSTHKILGGFGNLEDNLLQFPDGAFRAVAMRSYCPQAKTWQIWWLDGRNPTHLDVPVVGRFEAGRGVFFADDVLDGKPIKVRFIWNSTPAQAPTWEQAFSEDGGAHWETNWRMTFLPMDGAP